MYNQSQAIIKVKPVFEFHVRREIREFYNFDHSLFAQNGNVIFQNFYAVRLFAARMNQKRNLSAYPEQAIKAGQLNAMGLIDEILHYIVGLYKEQRNTDILAILKKKLRTKFAKNDFNSILEKFVADYPPLSVFRGKLSIKDYLGAETAGIKNEEIILEELILLYIANLNPAFSPFRELFDDTQLSKGSVYRQLMQEIHILFTDQPVFGPDHQNLIDMLRTPAIKHPNSLTDQLEFIRKYWGALLGKYILRLLSGLDLIKEEEKALFAGPGPTYLLDFAALGDEEYERFSTDLDWMPKVVMIAKSSYVWLDQLSKKYQRNIYHLDHIPDEELDILASRGFTALWLIGLWERSSASRKIKQMCGNPEAVSSAYSLYDYVIAEDLGGESAMQNLRKRAWKKGIRVASDMVPNHMGLYSKWVIEHPDWFIQSDHQLYPNYRFDGHNLSEDDRVGLFIENGYWTRTDAAVIFKRVDFHTGDVRYIYHGNDGTSMPWNDTAQLNFLMPEVREAVTQSILHVARQFPIIRLDAAMTLAKKHFQRLWYPTPGSGGDIPTRSEFALTTQQFNQLFPHEFWRDVVDRVAQEVPDTLLLAEAFWMMEGYFVRTLGMHRVYNSAFMNMLKNEENQKYRQAIKDVMDFNPEIMKRYVNFMNNPDEETAVAQFGKDDKYFGVCTLMVTLPGLPMFGHGQIEGYTEKYGMEYRRAYWDEQPDVYLIERHEREIFPLLKRRYLFSEVIHFVLYDFIDHHGHVNENVFSYSNRRGEERALVVYNNKYDRASGWIRYSSASADKEVNYSLRGGLALNLEPESYTIFRDQINGLEYIRNNDELEHQGLYVQLDGFKYHVFLDFRQVRDNEYHHYAQLTDFLNGRGVPSVEIALKETFLAPLHAPLQRLFALDWTNGKLRPAKKKVLLTEFDQNLETLLREVNKHCSESGDIIELKTVLQKQAEVLLNLDKITRQIELNNPILKPTISDRQIYYSWLLLHRLGMLLDADYSFMVSLSWLDEFLFTRILTAELYEKGFREDEVNDHIMLLRAMIIHSEWLKQCGEDIKSAFISLIEQTDSSSYLQVNRYQGILYFNKESLQKLLKSLLLISIISVQKTMRGEKKRIAFLQNGIKQIGIILKSAEANGYKVEATIGALDQF